MEYNFEQPTISSVEYSSAKPYFFKPKESRDAEGVNGTVNLDPLSQDEAEALNNFLKEANNPLYCIGYKSVKICNDGQVQLFESERVVHFLVEGDKGNHFVSVTINLDNSGVYLGSDMIASLNGSMEFLTRRNRSVRVEGHAALAQRLFKSEERHILEDVVSGQDNRPRRFARLARVVQTVFS